MSFSTSSITNDVLSTTIQHIHPEVVDGLYQVTPFLSVSQKLKKIKTGVGGNSLMVPVAKQDGATITSLINGWDEIDLTAQSVTDQAQFQWDMVAIPVMIAGKWESENSGKEAILSYADTVYREAMGELMRAVNRQIVRGSVSGFNTLNSLNGNAGSTYGQSAVLATGRGLLVPAIAGSQGYVGGLARGSVVGLNNQWIQAGTTLGRNDFFKAETLASMYLPSNGDGGVFHLTLASPAAYQIYRSAMGDQVRYVDSKSFDISPGGVRGIEFSTGAIFADPEMDVSASGDGKNSVMALNLDGVGLTLVKGGNFEFTGFTTPYNYHGRIGKIIFHGALGASHLGSQALITNGET